MPGHDDSITANAPPPFALVSVAAEVQVNGGTVGNMRIALGAAYWTWRAWNAEVVLRGAPATEELFRRAALLRNAFKVKVPVAHNISVRTPLDLMEDDRP